ncbi:Glyoxalase protein [Desulfitobacterium hafniense]|uniref:Glyoxalase protein n=1 Tax=Desulfitobacterium hafniense TaxID=49338 RepID=A0A098B8K2_DESHA|nr:VOC family protein [Desulfitobacterium hafniense]CDX04186.1 Glyoxalase protein [Desulfitobacterium hafniense]
MATYPHVVAHIGLTVPDIEAAVQWYTEMFGFSILLPPSYSAVGEGHNGDIGADIYGADFRANKMAMLGTGNGVGLELFEFVEPSTKNYPLEYTPWKPGYFHFAVMAPDVEGMAQKIIERGGTRISKRWDIAPGILPYQLCYVKDPWGNVIELFSHSNDVVMAPR